MFRSLTKIQYVGTVLAALLLTTGLAFGDTLTVNATTDIFLASQPDGSSVSGYFGSDTAPDNSPVAFDVTGLTSLSFIVSGSTSVDASCFAGADGGCYADQSGFSPAPASNLYNGPAGALLGFFTNGLAPDISSWTSGLDYQNSANLDLAMQAPLLAQIFFIGDGLTSSNNVQQFIIPTGATTLYLAVADSIGGSTGNVGSLAVTVTAVPVPAAFSLMGLGLAGLAVSRRKSV